MKTILISENNEDFAYVIKWSLEQEGFNVHLCSSGEKAIKLFQEKSPDILLLDINLDGDIDGKEVGRVIRRADQHTPIIFMSGENKSPKDVVEAFDIGCNFFLKKPVSLEEIIVHVNAALKVSSNNSMFKFEGCTFLVNERMLVINNKKEYLSDKESRVLFILAKNISNTVKLEDILSFVWNDTYMEEALRNIISSLRKKINGTNLKISTVKNLGYRLEQ